MFVLKNERYNYYVNVYGTESFTMIGKVKYSELLYE